MGEVSEMGEVPGTGSAALIKHKASLEAAGPLVATGASRIAAQDRHEVWLDDEPQVLDHAIDDEPPALPSGQQRSIVSVMTDDRSVSPGTWRAVPHPPSLSTV